MSSRYDISLFWGITIAQFMQAYAGVPTSGRGAVRTAPPWPRSTPTVALTWY